MIKRIVVFCLLIVFILGIAFCAEDTHLLNNGAFSAEDNVFMIKSESRFLSDAYFNEIESIFEQIVKENSHREVFNSSRKMAANAVLNKMMNDLEAVPETLHDHRNFIRFFDTFDKYIKMLDGITERMHYFRNTLNSYSDAPDDLNNMIDLAAQGKWRLFSAKFHRFNYGDINGSLNVKFVSEEGRFEAVYNTGTGKIVTDPANTGTYNYAPGSISPIQYYLHNKYDKIPWKKWGNIKGFTYDDIISLGSGQGPDAEINNKKVEMLIQKRKDELKK